MTQQKRSVLIVDDDHEVADTLAYIVGRNGYDVAVAYDGEWALQLASKRNFDFAFFDILLPGMNGVECFTKFKTHCPKAFAFMMTGYSSESLAALALKNGANDVLRKPVMPEDILARLERLTRHEILIVDDDQDVCSSISSLLRKLGWRCAAAADGETAIRMASQNTYSAMILDLKLPSISGIDVFSALQETGIDIPTLVVTGHDKDYQRIEHPSVFGYVQKPADPRVILALVERCNSAAN